MISHDDVFKIGQLGKTHGVKGEISFHFTDDVFDRVDADYVFVKIDGLLVPFFFEEYRFRSEETALVKFEGIDDADKASEMTGSDVFFPRQLTEDNDGELTWSALTGYTIIDSGNGLHIGEIEAVDQSTINTLFEVILHDSNTLLIPANEELIDDINRENRTITMRIPDGLMDIQS